METLCNILKQTESLKEYQKKQLALILISQTLTGLSLVDAISLSGLDLFDAISKK